MQQGGKVDEHLTAPCSSSSSSSSRQRSRRPQARRSGEVWQGFLVGANGAEL